MALQRQGIAARLRLSHSDRLMTQQIVDGDRYTAVYVRATAANPLPTGVTTRTPTTTSVASSATSVTVLAANANRKGVSFSNISTAKLYLSFATPATTANCFIEVPAGAFLLLDQQLIVVSAIYGIWASANGTVQVTEFV
jgi:hypothetical protein